MNAQRTVEAAIAEGLSTDTNGWNFDRFAGRMVCTPPPWDYRTLVDEVVGADAAALLDMGTGGGEWLAGWLASRDGGSGGARPRVTVATESWPPNAPVAARRLGPLGVTVVRAAGAADNVDQGPQDRSGPLPFASAAFDVVINRHEAYRPGEVARVLRPGGMFLTQQVGDDTDQDLRRLLELPTDGEPGGWTLRYAVDQAASAGLTVLDGGVGADTTAYHDVAPLLWYLRQAPWAVPDFDPTRHLDRIRAVAAHIERHGPVQVRRRYFWLRATRRPD